MHNSKLVKIDREKGLSGYLELSKLIKYLVKIIIYIFIKYLVKNKRLYYIV